MKAVIMTDEEYEIFRPIVDKFDMEIRDVQLGSDLLMADATLIAEKKMNKKRPWLVDLTITNKDGRSKTFTYNDTYMTERYEVVADLMYRAYTELLSDIKRLK